MEGSFTSYAFNTEKEYYLDLQSSRFGITTKRAGWDCLRHYEIAANGAVICFRNLSEKPADCAPHGLLDGMNCIAYRSFDELEAKINALDEVQYQKLLMNTLEWIKDSTTIKRAQQLLQVHQLANQKKGAS